MIMEFNECSTLFRGDFKLGKQAGIGRETFSLTTSGIKFYVETNFYVFRASPAKTSI